MDDSGPEVTSYHDLAALLRDRIRDGGLAPGDPVPSEAQLIRQYGVGRELVRRALRALRQEGLIEPVVGAAMRVKPVPNRTVIEVAPGSRVLAWMPDPRERALIAARDGTSVGDGVPVLQVVDEHGVGDLYPADRFELRTVAG